MADFKRPEDAFVFNSWDGVSNPFSGALKAGWDWDGNDRDAAQRCIENFSIQFCSAFLQPKAATGSNSSRPMHLPQVPPVAPASSWTQRLAQLGQISIKQDRSEAKRPILGQVEARHEDFSWTLQDLASAFPWQGQLRHITVCLNPRFTRIFSGIGPELYLFLTEGHLQGSNLIVAAQLVHEFGHLDHGLSIGWQKFQECSRLETEMYAIQAELLFLKQQCKRIGISWESSWIRRDWNHSYARLAPEISSIEAAEYLRLIEQVDPA